jgi:anti-anti-sigma factor
LNDKAVMATCELSELVRGHEAELVERISPLVRQQSVVLDMARVERIDAAGIATLISLYGLARDAGHCFMVSSPTAHVRELLTLVGLDRILLAQNAAGIAELSPCMQLSAA